LLSSSSRREPLPQVWLETIRFSLFLKRNNENIILSCADPFLPMLTRYMIKILTKILLCTLFKEKQMEQAVTFRRRKNTGWMPQDMLLFVVTNVNLVMFLDFWFFTVCCVTPSKDARGCRPPHVRWASTLSTFFYFSPMKHKNCHI
jgi:hypothetical protein